MSQNPQPPDEEPQDPEVTDDQWADLRRMLAEPLADANEAKPEPNKYEPKEDYKRKARAQLLRRAVHMNYLLEKYLPADFQMERQFITDCIKHQMERSTSYVQSLDQFRAFHINQQLEQENNILGW